MMVPLWYRGQKVVSGACYMVCAMTATRTQADALLKGIAGPNAQLRDDQWSAIDALVNK